MFKKIFNVVVVIIVSIVFCSNNLFADDQASLKKELQNKLSTIKSYQASFNQQMSKSSAKNPSNTTGKLYIRRPDLFRLETSPPNDNLILSDGKTLWLYDPFVQQVTANYTKNVVDKSPFILLTSNDDKYWSKYSITKAGDTYFISPNNTQGELKTFEVRITETGILKSFRIVYKNGQTNWYDLYNIITNVNLSTKLFKFDIPKDVELDDQRKK